MKKTEILRVGSLRNKTEEFRNRVGFRLTHLTPGERILGGYLGGASIMVAGVALDKGLISGLVSLSGSLIMAGAYLAKDR